MSVYTIPLKYRKMENLHIVFWIFKDIGWCLIWKPLGIMMIFPTLIISIIIAWRTRHMMAELTHNLAITLWILANSYWMSTEFLGIDALTVYGGITFKQMAIVPFLMGVCCLAYYYLLWAPRHPEHVELYDVGNDVAISNPALVGNEELVEQKSTGN
jgi:hypothetical protein